MSKCNEKLWLEDIKQLFSSMNIIPLDCMGLAGQMNSITRMVFVIFIILLLFGFRQSLLFLLLSLLFIIILYYIQRNNMEHYISPQENAAIRKEYANARVKAVREPSAVMSLIVDKPLSRALCGPATLIDVNNPNYVTETQRLVGPANPKTFIAPIITPSIQDDYWKANNLTYRTGINERRQFDTARSGYQVTTCCANPSDEACPDIKPPPQWGIDPLRYAEPVYTPPLAVAVKEKCSQDVELAEGYSDLPYMKEPGINVRANQPGWVNTSCGYNPEQTFTAGLPANYAVGNCQKNPAMKEHNEQVFTQIIQPGVYMRSDVNEPVNSNIGISFAQQNQPTAQITDSVTGEVMFIEQDPRLISDDNQDGSLCAGASVTEADVYDPRSNGYGTSYRAYSEDVTGQTRFYYDDINAIRMPNYLTRNNIDHTTFGDTYGPIPEGFENGNPRNSDIRALAQDAFLNASICHRNDVQFALMRKTNNQRWQRRIAPISTSGQRGAGSTPAAGS
jgi:hypothetical protein